ncbi:MAG: helix-turn-helix domain-containing protein [Pseudomonadota bacterium]
MFDDESLATFVILSSLTFRGISAPWMSNNILNDTIEAQNMQKDTLPKLAFTIPEACQAIGISRSKIYELIGHGRIEARKIGSRTVIPAKDLEKFIDELP